jgi:hypothetical protein
MGTSLIIVERFFGRYTETVYPCKSSAGAPRALIYFSVVCRDPIVGAGFKPALKVRFILSADPCFGEFAGIRWGDHRLSKPA